MRRFNIVKVIWKDPTDHFDKGIDSSFNYVINNTVGYKVKEDEENIRICWEYENCEDGIIIGDFMDLPKALIISIKEIKDEEV